METQEITGDGYRAVAPDGRAQSGTQPGLFDLDGGGVAREVVCRACHKLFTRNDLRPAMWVQKCCSAACRKRWARVVKRTALSLTVCCRVCGSEVRRAKGRVGHACCSARCRAKWQRQQQATAVAWARDRKWGAERIAVALGVSAEVVRRLLVPRPPKVRS